MEESAYEIDETAMAPELEKMSEADRLIAEAQNRERTLLAKDKTIRDQANKIITKMLGQRCPRDNWGSYDLKEKDRTEEEMATPAKKRTRNVAVGPVPLGGPGSGAGRKRGKPGHTETAEEEQAILDSVEAMKRRRREKQQEESQKMAEQRAERNRVAAMERKKREEMMAEKKKKAAVMQKAADERSAEKVARRQAAKKRAAGRGKSSREKAALSEEVVRDDGSSESDFSASVDESSDEEETGSDEEGDEDVTAGEMEGGEGGDEDVTAEEMEVGEGAMEVGEGAMAPAAAEETEAVTMHGDGGEERALKTRKGKKGRGDGSGEDVPVRRSARLG